MSILKNGLMSEQCESCIKSGEIRVSALMGLCCRCQFAIYGKLAEILDKKKCTHEEAFTELFKEKCGFHETIN